MKKKVRRKAFTLVEILLVTAILVVLSAILFSVFVRVREKGRQTTCLNNLRQMGAAIQMYVRDYDDVYPTGYQSYDEGLDVYIRDWRIRWCPSNRLQAYSGTASLALCDNGEYSIEYCRANIDACGMCSWYYSNYEYNVQVLNDWPTSFSSVGSPEAKLLPFSQVIVLSETKWVEKMMQGTTERTCTLGSDEKGNSKLYRGFGVYPFVYSGGNYLFADGHVKWLQR